MREILFRGKNIDNGEWVEGYYCPVAYERFPCRASIISKNDADSGWWHPEEIDPETVGQYTGLTDKNGKKVFEGDIIQTIREGYKFEQVFKFVVKYGEYTPKDYCKAIYSQYATIGFYSTNGNKDFQLSTCSNCIETIGNIYDNPELLGDE